MHLAFANPLQALRDQHGVLVPDVLRGDLLTTLKPDTPYYLTLRLGAGGAEPYIVAFNVLGKRIEVSCSRHAVLSDVITKALEKGNALGRTPHRSAWRLYAPSGTEIPHKLWSLPALDRLALAFTCEYILTFTGG